MTEDEYINTQSKVVLFGAMLLELDLEAFLADSAHAHAVGSMLDAARDHPAAGVLRNVPHVARALQEAQRRILGEAVEK